MQIVEFFKIHNSYTATLNPHNRAYNRIFASRYIESYTEMQRHTSCTIAMISVEFRQTMQRLMPMTHTRHLEYARARASVRVRC